MIKKIASAFCFGLLGLALAYLINFCIQYIGAHHPGANVFPHCEECDANAFVAWLVAVIPLLAFVAFAFAGRIILGRNLAARQTLLIFGALAVLILFADETVYTSFLIGHSDALYANREIQADEAFASAVIGKTDIQVYDRDGSKLKAAYLMKQWERCAVGDEDKKAALVSINCKKGDGWIKKSDADNLTKLPMQ